MATGDRAPWLNLELAPPVPPLYVLQEMNKRLTATLVIVSLVGALTFVVALIAFMDDVSSETFDAFIRDHAPSYIEAQQTSSASSLPLLVSIRFPKSDSKGGLEFPDRTDIYTLASTSGGFECHAHVRRDRVCLVTFEGSAPRSELRERLMANFPKLSIR